MSDTPVHNLIIGHQGQDGTLLREQLNAEGLTWVGVDQGVLESTTGLSSCFASAIDVADPEQVGELVRWCKPAEIHYLAAYHQGSARRAESPSTHLVSGLRVNVLGPLNFLKAIEAHCPKSRFVYASSSLVYAPTESPEERIDESYPKTPAESYAFEKALVGNYCAQYRDRCGIHANTAILFNHESRYRPSGFFTRDVTDALTSILRGELSSWEVGSLDAIVDWSYAGDTVDAIRRIARGNNPGEYIVSSGIAHTTGDLINIACRYVGLDMKTCIKCNPEKTFRNNTCRIGNSTKLRNETGWAPTKTFNELVVDLMQASIDRRETEPL